jgi:flagellar hook-associated protein 1 FlgK
MGVSTGFTIATGALSAFRAAMQTSGHNIANVNTPGYTRQRSIFVSNKPEQQGFGLMGTGVTLSTVSRVRDHYLDLQLNAELSQQGLWVQREDVLSQLELYFNETSDTGLGSLMSEMWLAWQDLASNPESDSSRAGVLQAGTQLTDAMNEQMDNLRDLRRNLDNAVETKVREINTLTSQIAELNHSIVSAESDGHKANDLRDQRDAMTANLSTLIDFDLFEQSDGAYTLTLDNKTLVFAAESFELETYPDSASDLQLLGVRWAGTSKAVLPQDGELGGILYSRDTIIPQYEMKLEHLARAMIENINRVHAQGRGLVPFTSVTGTYAVSDASAVLNDAGLTFAPGAGSFNIIVADSVMGTENTYTINVDSSTDSLEDVRAAINLAAGTEITASINGSNQLVISGNNPDKSFVFDADSSDTLMSLGVNTFFSGNGAADISVNSVIQNSPGYIAHARSNAPSDNSNALAVVGLRTAAVMVDDTMTMEKYYSSNIVGELGSEEQKAIRMVDNQNLIVDQVRDSIDEVSSVSIDEEMADLIQLQHAISAIARYIGILGEMLDEVINIV